MTRGQRTIAALPLIVLAGYFYVTVCAHSLLLSLPYYSPGTGTQDVVYGYVPAPITLSGDPLPAPVMVISEIGQRYDLINPQGHSIFSQKMSLSFKMGQDNTYFY